MSEETKNIIAVGLLLFALLAFITPLLFAINMELEERKKRGDPPEYDERQRMIRLRAGNHALFALVGFLVAWTAANQFDWFPGSESILDMTMCALILAWGVWAADCILHDAFISWKDKRKNGDALALAYCWMLFTWTNPSDWGMEICDTWLPFSFSCAYLVILSGVVIYKARKRKKAEAEDAV